MGKTSTDQKTGTQVYQKSLGENMSGSAISSKVTNYKKLEKSQKTGVHS